MSWVRFSFSTNEAEAGAFSSEAAEGLIISAACTRLVPYLSSVKVSPEGEIRTPRLKWRIPPGTCGDISEII